VCGRPRRRLPQIQEPAAPRPLQKPALAVFIQSRTTDGHR
jgi:hypothetical protein